MGKPDTKIILSWNWNYKVDKGKVLPSSLSSTPALMVSTANCCHSFRGLWFSLIKFLQILARALATCFISHYLQPAQFQRNSKEQKFSFLVIRVHKLHRSVNNVQKSNIFVDKHAQTTKWRLSSSIGQIEDSVALVRHILHMILHLFAVLLLTCGHYLLKDHDVLYT